MNDSMLENKVELQISCGVFTKIQEASFLQRKKEDSRRDIKTTVCKEEREYRGGGDMPRPYPYALRNTTEDERVEFHGISEREKQLDEI